MSANDPLANSGPSKIQAMPYVQGYIDLTTGIISDKKVVMCKSDGEITLTFADTTTKATNMIEGETRTIPTGCSVTITDAGGTFDFA